MSHDETRVRRALSCAFRYALALTHDHWLAEDLVSEACLATANSGARLDEAYLMTAVRWRYVDHLRRSGRERAAQNGLTEDARSSPAPDRASGPPHSALDGALRSLRPEEREVLFLHVVSGLSVRDIVQATDKPRGTILSLLQRGRQKLADRLQPSELEA